MRFLVEDAVEDVDQQPRGGEEAAGEHADRPALPVHGVQEEIPPGQRGEAPAVVSSTEPVLRRSAGCLLCEYHFISVIFTGPLGFVVC